MTDTTLENLEPKPLWGHFDQLRRIPRESRHEEQVVAHVKAWAATHKFPVKQDKVGNLVIQVPATPGHEKAPIVILQGHLDMVAEKDKDTQHDFAKDPIPVVIDGDWVVAPKTTLGADNGIGIAAAMASADDPQVEHGPLELLFTIDEETALTGASGLDGSILEGRTLINLDSEEDGTLFVGCAGGCTTEGHLDFPRTPAPAGHVPVCVEVTGLKGGHSGLMIHENRGNSLKVLARVLAAWMQRNPVFLHAVEGGNKHNAIPREASATAFVPAGFVAEAQDLAQQVVKKVLQEVGTIDPGLVVRVNAATGVTGDPASAATSRRLVSVLTALPHGVVAMSRDIPGLTETSTNLAVLKTQGSRVVLTTSSRSSVEPALRWTLDQVRCVEEMGGAQVKEMSGYPGWQPNMASKVLAAAKETHKELSGKEPHVTAIHAGLECGIIGEKLGGNVDMVSYGPELQGVHAPGEKVRISSVQRFWTFHKALLKRLA
jgi:dipeptidase D